jgi:hypothetical protein
MTSISCSQPSGQHLCSINTYTFRALCFVCSSSTRSIWNREIHLSRRQCCLIEKVTLYIRVPARASGETSAHLIASPESSNRGQPGSNTPKRQFLIGTVHFLAGLFTKDAAFEPSQTPSIQRPQAYERGTASTRGSHIAHYPFQGKSGQTELTCKGRYISI